MIRKAFVIAFMFGYSVSMFPQSWQKVQLLPQSEPNNDMLDCNMWSDTGVIVGSYGKIFHTTDFFHSYRIDSTYHSNLFTGMCFANHSIGYISSCTVSGGMLKTTDGGYTWSPLLNNPLCIGEAIFFISTDTGYSSFHQGAHQFIFTLNGGQNWYGNPLPIAGFDVGVTKIEQVQDSFLYITSIYGQGNSKVFTMYRTSDLGAHWQQTYSSNWSVTSYCDFHFIDDTTVLLVTNGAILKSKNEGFDFDTVLYTGWNNVIAFGKRAVSFVGLDTGFVAYTSSVYKTTDRGDSWEKTDFSFDDNDVQTGTEITFIKGFSSEKVIVGCSNGSIYKTETGGGVWSNVSETNNQTPLTIYPNPTHSSFFINFTDEEPQSLQATMFDITGKFVFEEKFSNPTSKTEMELPHLSVGIYLVQFTYNNKTVYKKLLID